MKTPINISSSRNLTKRRVRPVEFVNGFPQQDFFDMSKKSQIKNKPEISRLFAGYYKSSFTGQKDCHWIVVPGEKSGKLTHIRNY
jgi:hypothetical protein